MRVGNGRGNRASVMIVSRRAERATAVGIGIARCPVPLLTIRRRGKGVFSVVGFCLCGGGSRSVGSDRLSTVYSSVI